MQPTSKMMSSYESVVRKLYQVNMWSPMKYGLENSETIQKLLGNPMSSKPIVHVAGTNGKGSVAFKIARALREAGYKDGLFASPHVSSFRERMQVNGEVISEDEVASTLPMLLNLCVENKIPATFFELTTALAFLHFKKADVVVLEVGLGGRLDATNVITPTLSIITSIGLDHTRILGSTVEEIALEKAGIMKPGVPVIVGPRVPLSVLENRAKEVGSPFYEATSLAKTMPSPNPVKGGIDFDEENSLVARAALMTLTKMKGFEKLDQRAIDIGVSCRPPCRFEEMVIYPSVTHYGANKHVSKTSFHSTNKPLGASDMNQGGELKEDTRVAGGVDTVLDVGHNPPALEQLLSKISTSFGTRPIRFVLGMCRDKDIDTCLKLILQSKCSVSHIHFVQAQHPRAAIPSELVDSAVAMGVDQSLLSVGSSPLNNETDQSVSESGNDVVVGSVTDGVNGALRLALGTDEVVVVCGSVFMMAEARESLGIVEPRDSRCIMEVVGAHFKKVEDVCTEETSER